MVASCSSSACSSSACSPACIMFITMPIIMTPNTLTNMFNICISIIRMRTRTLIRVLIIMFVIGISSACSVLTIILMSVLTSILINILDSVLIIILMNTLISILMSILMSVPIYMSALTSIFINSVSRVS